MATASETSDPESPFLDDHAAEGALRLLRFGLETAQKHDVVTKGAPRLHPEVVTAEAARIALRDCVDGTHWLQYKKSGGLKNNVPGGHNYTQATVRKDGGIWKVTDLYMSGVGSC